MTTDTARGAEGDVLLRAAGLAKAFGGAPAVRSADLELRRGQVHALIGENGAGKSTVIKMLSGAERPDAGEIVLDGEPVSFRTPADAAAAGIATVFQELDLIDDLSIAANVMLGREPRRGGFLRPRQLRREAERALAAAGSTIDVDASPRDLPLAQQQRAVIARCLLADAKLLILDEPTAPLGPREVEELFALVRQLTDRGVSILFVSHRLEEVLEIAEVVTVMRDGEVVATRAAAETDEAELISLMTGRQIDLTAVKTPRPAGSEVAFAIRGLPLATGVLDLDVAPGEIVGIAGLAGSGRSRLLENIIGAPWVGGRVTVRGTEYDRLSPARAIEAGIAFLPEDRKRQGLVMLADSPFNVSLSALVRQKGPWVTAGRDRRRLDETIERMSLRGNPMQSVGGLSGGNQQKVLLGRLLAIRPDVILLDEPTRGVDIGAKKQIWDLLAEIAAAGTAIVMVSSELPEILRLSDRILVLADGSVTGEFPAGTPQETLLEAALPRRDKTPAVAGAGKADAS